MPFTIQEFLHVFARYNSAIWPLQFVMVAAAVTAVTLAARGTSGRIVAAYLAVQWAWTGIVYHWLFFAEVNPAARAFAVVWLAGACAFAWSAIKGNLTFRSRRRADLWVAGVLIAYALAVYPVIGLFSGHVYPHAPTFGAPCPVTILTIGLLWLARPPRPRYLLVAPILWAAVGGSGAFLLKVPEDFGLIVAGLAVLMLLFMPRAAQTGRLAQAG